MKLLILILSLFLLSACGLDIEGNDTREEDLEQREKLKVEYSPAVGTYLGEVTKSKKNKNPIVEIKLFITEEEKGTDNYGKPRVFPTLKGYWRLLRDDGIEILGLPLSAQFIEESSTIILTTDNSGGNSSKGKFSMTGTLIDGVLEGDIYLARGYYGYFKGFLKENN